MGGEERNSDRERIMSKKEGRRERESSHNNLFGFTLCSNVPNAAN